MQVREPDREPDTVKPGGGVELADSLVLDPRLRRGDKPDFCLSDGIHVL
jgi:hypothetical protein